MKLKTFRFAPLAAVLLAAVFLHGCGYRAAAAPLASNAPAAAETTPAPTETPVFMVEYRLGDDVLKTESIPVRRLARCGRRAARGSVSRRMDG